MNITASRAAILALIPVLAIILIVGLYISASTVLTPGSSLPSTVTSTSTHTSILSGNSCSYPCKGSISVENQNVNFSNYFLDFNPPCRYSTPQCEASSYEMPLGANGSFAVNFQPSTWVVDLSPCPWSGCSSLFPLTINIVNTSQPALLSILITGASTVSVSSSSCTISGEATGFFLHIVSGDKPVEGAKLAVTQVDYCSSSAPFTTMTDSQATFITNSSGWINIQQLQIPSSDYYLIFNVQFSNSTYNFSKTFNVDWRPQQGTFVTLDLPSGNTAIQYIMPTSCSGTCYYPTSSILSCTITHYTVLGQEYVSVQNGTTITSSTAVTSISQSTFTTSVYESAGYNTTNSNPPSSWEVEFCSYVAP
ncbi:MAG: hypothetical protein ACYC7D_15965 [Nitrososphaerales archaeon]